MSSKSNNNVRASNNIRGLLSGESSSNISPIKGHRLEEQSSVLQVEEYSNISDISYGEDLFKNTNKEVKKKGHLAHRHKKLSSNFTGPGFRIQA